MESNHGNHINTIITIFGLEFDWWMILMALLTSVILIVVAWLASRKISWLPSGWQNIMEYAIEFVEKLTKDALGKHGVKYTYFFGSLFLFILIANMLGLIPGLASPTKDVSVNFALAFMWLIWMQYIGIRENGLKGHIKHFFQPFVPYVLIHLLELVIRSLTLTMRLFANIYAGEVMLEKLTEYFPVLIPGAWIAMSIIIGGIQAFIFTILTVSYTGLAVSHEDNEHSNEGPKDVSCQTAREH